MSAKIGVVGADVPRELVFAAGGDAVRLRPDVGDLSDSETLRAAHRRASDLLGSVDIVAVDLLAGLLAGSWGRLDGVVFCRDREASLRIFTVLRELGVTDPDIPPVHLVDIVHLPRQASLDYDIAQLRRLVHVLTTWTGRAVSLDDVRTATLECAGVRQLLARCDVARSEGRLPGSQWLALVEAAETLPLDVAAVTIRQALAQVTQPARRPRLFVSGSVQHDVRLYSMIEARGWDVVGEDHERGALALSVDVDPGTVSSSATVDQVIEILARAYWRRGPDAASASATARADHALRGVRARGADAALSVVRLHDEAPLWDFPALRTALKGIGVPAVLLRDQGRSPDPAQLDDALAGLSMGVTGQGSGVLA